MSEYYRNQALKPRGQSNAEKVQFLANWYSTSAAKVEPTDSHQADFLKIMGEWGQILSNLEAEDVDRKLTDALTLANHSLKNAKTTAEKAFYNYLIIEIERCRT